MKKWYPLRSKSGDPAQFERFRFLTVAILVMIVLNPFLENLPGLALLTEAVFFGVLIAGVYAVSGERHPKRIAVILAVGFMTARILASINGDGGFVSASLVLFALFLLQTLFYLVRHINAQEKVGKDLVFAGVCAYLLVGVIWACGYFLIARLIPGSFNGADPRDGDFWNFIYFSYVTLTSTGFGDISPVTKPARALAMLEAIIGQLSMAIMIGRLVGAYASNALADRK